MFSCTRQTGIGLRLPAGVRRDGNSCEVIVENNECAGRDEPLLSHPANVNMQLTRERDGHKNWLELLDERMTVAGCEGFQRNGKPDARNAHRNELRSQRIVKTLQKVITEIRVSRQQHGARKTIACVTLCGTRSGWRIRGHEETFGRQEGAIDENFYWPMRGRSRERI